MADIRKPQMLRSMLGLNGHQAGAALAQGPDNVPAMITDQSGTPQQPAMIKQGEIIFSVEAVIGAGQGDYHKGAQILTQLQEELRAHGTEFLQKHSLAGAGGPTGQ